MTGDPGTAENTTAGSPNPPHHAADRWPRPTPRSLFPAPAAPAGPARRRSPRTVALQKTWWSYGHHLMSGRRVGNADRLGHPDEDRAWPFVGLPAVRGADVVDQHQVPDLPRLPHRVGLINRVDQLHDLLGERLAGAEASVERQP